MGNERYIKWALALTWPLWFLPWAVYGVSMDLADLVLTEWRCRRGK